MMPMGIHFWQFSCVRHAIVGKEKITREHTHNAWTSLLHVPLWRCKQPPKICCTPPRPPTQTPGSLDRGLYTATPWWLRMQARLGWNWVNMGGGKGGACHFPQQVPGCRQLCELMRCQQRELNWEGATCSCGGVHPKQNEGSCHWWSRSQGPQGGGVQACDDNLIFQQELAEDTAKW